MQTQTMAESTPSFFQRNSWPLGIVLGLALFMGMTLYFVKKAFSERVDLVATDYYYRDKFFSERLAREKNLLRHGQMTVTHEGGAVTLRLPAYFTAKKITGTLSFYSPLNPADDFSLPVAFSGNHATIVTRADQSKIWRVGMDFTAGGESFFAERILTAK